MSYLLRILIGFTLPLAVIIYLFVGIGISLGANVHSGALSPIEKLVNALILLVIFGSSLPLALVRALFRPQLTYFYNLGLTKRRIVLVQLLILGIMLLLMLGAHFVIYG